MKVLVSTKVFWGSLALASMIVVKPVSQPKKTYRYISSGLTIQMNKEAPPRILFDLINESKLEDKYLDQENFQINESNLNEVVSNLKIEKPKTQIHAHDFIFPKSADAIRISGTIQLKGGALLGENTLELRRVEGGVSQEIGHIDYSKATFFIDVKVPNGTLVARILSPTGSVIAKGDYRLPKGVTQRRITGVEIIVERNQGFAFDLQDEGKIVQERGAIYSPGLISQNLNKEEGEYSYSGYSYNSSLIVTADTKTHIKTNHVVQSGSRQSLPVYTKGLANAAINLVRQELKASQNEQNDSLIWGKVISDFGALSNTKVEIEGHPDYQPTYINAAWLPDGNLNATSESGGFFFVDLPEGFYSIKATVGNKYIAHSNVKVQNGTVSPVTLKASIMVEAVNIKVFDAFTGNPTSAKVELQSLAESVLVNGFREVYFSPIERLSMMSVQPITEEYLPANYQYWDNDDEIHAPLISSTWLNPILDLHKNQHSKTNGLIIGFVPDQDFEVFMSQEMALLKPNTIYFNSQGEIVEQGVSGGGFLILNVPPGVETVVVASKNTSDLSTRLVPIDTDRMSIVKFHF